jgi:hypothetical protein
MTLGEYVFAVTMTVVIVWLVAEVSNQDVVKYSLGEKFNPGRE